VGELSQIFRVGPGGVRAGTRRRAGCAIPTSSAGHAQAGAKADPKLTFDSDHLVGAAHINSLSEQDTAGTLAAAYAHKNLI
jgi:hypothetical protein